MNCRNVIIILMLILLGIAVASKSSPSKENYGDVYYNKGLNTKTLTRPTFNSNLDPRNLNVRSDPYSYGGYIKGTTPNVGNMASNNKISSFRMGDATAVGDQTISQALDAGMNDAANSVSYNDNVTDSVTQQISTTEMPSQKQCNRNQCIEL